MIQSRSRRCPLRQPRIWVWALTVALPAHIGVAAALGWRSQGTLVACPVTNPLQVRLHEAQPVQAAVPASRQVAALAAQAKVSKPFQTDVKHQTKTRPAPKVRTDVVHQSAIQVNAPQTVRTRVAMTPAGGLAQPASLGVIAARDLGFRNPPQPPVYPAASRARNEEGTATVLALLVAQGSRPQELKLERSSGYSRLDQAALAAAANWDFNAPSAPTWVRVPVRFALRD